MFTEKDLIGATRGQPLRDPYTPTWLLNQADRRPCDSVHFFAVRATEL